MSADAARADIQHASQEQGQGYGEIDMTSFIIPFLVVFIVIYGFIKNVNIYDKFLEGENRYTMLKAVDPKLAKDLLNQNKEYAKERFEYYKNFKAK